MAEQESIEELLGRIEELKLQSIKLRTEIADLQESYAKEHQKYADSCVFLALMLEAARGALKFQPEGLLEEVHNVRKDADRYYWIRDNIGRLGFTIKQVSEDVGVGVDVTEIQFDDKVPRLFDKKSFDSLLDGVITSELRQ